MHKDYQQTINSKIKLSGIGLHNGSNVNLTIRPAEENFGIKFSRVDIDGGRIVLEVSW